MAVGEFDLIGQYFTNDVVQREDVIKGIGDDCAILNVPVGKQLVVTTDTMVSSVHFLADANPKDIAHKLVAVNISDLAAMGAEPAWASLAISLPHSDQAWLSAFSQSLHQQLQRYGVSLIGGDTTKGPLSLTLTVQGFVEQGKALQRSGANLGDVLFCTGSLGDAAAGLQVLLDQNKTNDETTLSLAQNDTDFLISRHQRPTARVEWGQCLVDIASSCIDLSDGLASDLLHVLKASTKRVNVSDEMNQVSLLNAEIELSALPMSTALKRYGTAEQRLHYALAGGDDYELLFTVPKDKVKELEAIMLNHGLSCTEIGHITLQELDTSIQSDNNVPQINFLQNNQAIEFALKGWDHFQ